MKIEHSTDRVDETTYKFMLRPRDFSNLMCLRNTKIDRSDLYEMAYFGHS